MSRTVGHQSLDPYRRPLGDDSLFAARIAQVEIELMALEMTVMRVLSARGKAPGPEASILKVRGTEIQQALITLLMEAAGPYALLFDSDASDRARKVARLGPDYAGPLAAHYLNYRKASIYGGSNEIQRTIIAQLVLGL